MTSQVNCKSCHVVVREKQQKVCCILCEASFHRTCIKGFTQERYRTMKKDQLLEHWTCTNCSETTEDIPCIEISDDEETESQTKKKPQAPTKPLKFSNIKPTSLTLCWGMSPDDNGPDTHYHISFTNKLTGEEEVTASLTNHIAIYRVTDLSPNTEYVVNITFENVHGKSDSITGTVTTKKQEKPQAPTKPMKFSNIKPTSLSLCWGMSLDDDGPDTHYHISFTNKLTGEEEVTASLTNHIAIYRVTDLSPNTEYVVNITFENVHGKSDSIIGTVTTKKQAKPRGPEKPISFKNIKQSSVTVTWVKSPDEDSSDSFYRIFVREGNPTVNDVEWSCSYTSESNTYVLNDLSPNTEYLVGVCLETTTGRSDAIYDLVKTKAGKPRGTEIPLRFKNIKQSSVTVMWAKSPDEDVCGSFYHICVRERIPRVKDDEWLFSFTSESNTYDINDLSPNTEYLVGVGLETTAGKSDAVYDLVKTKAEESIPERPSFDYDMQNIPMYEVLDEVVKTQPLCGNMFQRGFSVNPDYLGAKRLDKDHEAIVQLRYCHKEPNKTKMTKLQYLPATIHLNGRRIYTENDIDLTNKKTTSWSHPIDISKYSYLAPFTNRLTLHASSEVKDTEGLLGDICVSVSIVKVIPVTELCERLMATCLQTPDSTKALIKTKFSSGDDCDIATTSVHASLRCPVGKTKLKYPCRGRMCKHIQCEDALTILSLNSSKPEFDCYTCSMPCSYYDLVIDGLFLEILRAVPETVNDVEFKEDGSWTYKGEKSMEADKENDPTVIELNLSNALEMIDLTETDDEMTPRKQPIKKQKVLDKGLAKTGRQPLKINTVIMNTGSSDSSRPTFGENYQNSDSIHCHRYNRHNRSNHRRACSPRMTSFRNRRQQYTSSTTSNRPYEYRNSWYPYYNQDRINHRGHDNNAYYNQQHGFFRNTFARTVQSSLFDIVNRLSSQM